MAKEIRTENWRVVVTPEMFLSRTDDEKQGSCRALIKDIQRHVDGFVDIDWEADETAYCSLCGERWETEDDGLPMCCDTAREEYEKALAAESK